MEKYFTFNISYRMCTSISLPLSCLFDRIDEQQCEHKIETKLKEKTKQDHWLYCATCQTKITHEDERIQVDSSHEHRFTNPQGMSFTIGCFRTATGCSLWGEETLEWTWFSGYAWRIAVCAQCQHHLGWRYRSPNRQFHGLILNRLTSKGK